MSPRNTTELTEVIAAEKAGDARHLSDIGTILTGFGIAAAAIQVLK